MNGKGESDNRYPNGKLNEHDAGALYMQMTIEKNVIVLHFGEPVTWIGLTPQDAMEIAQALISHARTIANKTGDVLTLEL